MAEQSDWDNLLVDDDFFFDFELPFLSELPPAETFSIPSSEPVTRWLGQIESMLMNDDNQKQQITLASDQQTIPEFLGDFIVDSPIKRCLSGGVIVDSLVHASDDSRHPSPEKENADGSADKKSDASDDSGNGSPDKINLDGSSDKVSDFSDASGNRSPEKENAGLAEVDNDGEHKKSADEVDVDNDGEHPDDPVAKKRRRQLRNRNAAARSRERKKLNLKDLEMKSKYVERECMRLGPFASVLCCSEPSSSSLFA